MQQALSPTPQGHRLYVRITQEVSRRAPYPGATNRTPVQNSCAGPRDSRESRDSRDSRTPVLVDPGLPSACSLCVHIMRVYCRLNPIPPPLKAELAQWTEGKKIVMDDLAVKLGVAVDQVPRAWL